MDCGSFEDDEWMLSISGFIHGYSSQRHSLTFIIGGLKSFNLENDLFRRSFLN